MNTRQTDSKLPTPTQEVRQPPPIEQSRPTRKDLGEEDIAEHLKNMLSSNGKAKKHMTSEDLDKMIEESEYIQRWKAIPKARRERLTRKQMIAMG